MTDASFLQAPPPPGPEIPPDRLPCPRCMGRNDHCSRCGGLGHLAPSEIRGACRTLWWDMTVDPPVQRACPTSVPDDQWRDGARDCPAHLREKARLAELREGSR